MILAARTIAAATLSILAGSAAAQESMDEIIDALKLPVGRTATYFNNATKTAISEQCFRSDENTVACNLRVMANKALLDFTYQAQAYHLENGNLTIYAMANFKPDGWVGNWNRSDRPVIWGYTGE